MVTTLDPEQVRLLEEAGYRRLTWFWFYGTSGQGSRKISNGRGLTDPADARALGSPA